jgi:hypothetical protein
MGLELKDYKVLRSLMQHAYHPTLTALAMWCSVRHSKFMITSAFRDDKDSLHGHCRSLDLRCHWFTDVDRMMEDLNNHWEYDPKRPDMVCAAVHKPDHIHLKVHDRTVYHEKEKS